MTILLPNFAPRALSSVVVHVSVIRSLCRSVWFGELHFLRARAAPAVPNRAHTVRDICVRHGEDRLLIIRGGR
jgi:hypothetical protein